MTAEPDRRLTKLELDPADCYQVPSKLADAIQQPLWPAGKWQQRVLNAYAATRLTGRAALARSEGE